MILVNVAVGAWLVALVLVTSDGGVSVPDLLAVVYGGAALAPAWAFIVVRRRVRGQQNPLGPLLVAPVLMLLGAIVFVTDSAFYSRFLLSRPALARYATQVRAGAGPSANPTRVGLFVARETEVLEDGTVRIVTAEDMFDHAGVAFRASGQPPRVGEDSYEAIGDGWWRWWRSW